MILATLRMIADDLTGALDTAAEFVSLVGQAPVYGTHPALGSLPPTAVLDTATRELSRAAAIARMSTFAPALIGADIAYYKIDSLLRGHGAAELAICFQLGQWRSAVLAPAFPFQGRITRGGQQWRRGEDGGLSAVGGGLVAALLAEGVPAHHARLGKPLADGINVFDAETDADLVAIVREVRASGERVLWSGSGGLARVMAGQAAPMLPAPVRHPLLGVFGSDQRVTANQLAQCAPWRLQLTGASAQDAGCVMARLAEDAAVLVDFALPDATPRDMAADMIGAAIAGLLPQLPVPRSLVVAGGETLRSACNVLGVHHLDVTGAIMPGVPRSIIRGGVWDGVEIISKSGAFGDPMLLRHLLQLAEIDIERTGS